MGGEWEAGASGPRGGGIEETGVTYVHSLSIYNVLVRLLVNDYTRQEEQRILKSCPRIIHPETPYFPSPSRLRASDQFILRNRRRNVEMFMSKYYFGS